MPGPPKKPTALKIVQGTATKADLTAAEPKPTLAKRPPPAPKHLTPAAKREYRRMAKQLIALDLLTDVDGPILAAYATSYARWAEAEEKIAEEGSIVITPNGYPVQSAWLQIANKALANMHRYALEFGMTPAARARIRVEEPPTQDAYETFRRQRSG